MLKIGGKVVAKLVTNNIEYEITGFLVQLPGGVIDHWVIADMENFDRHVWIHKLSEKLLWVTEV
jgi:hypothetical protein